MYNVNYSNSAFTQAATSVSITLFSLPVDGVIEGIRMKHSVPFAGTGITSVSCSLGTSSDSTAYSAPFNVTQAVGDTVQYWDGGAYSATAAAHDVILTCTANANFGNGTATNLTAGNLDIWVKYGVLP